MQGVLAEETCPVIRSWNGLSNVTAAGFAIHPYGNVYVTDSANNRVMVFSETGKYLFSWGSERPGDGQFKAPRGIAIDRSGTVYVADTGNHTIQKISSRGFFLWGREGTESGQFDSPVGIAVDSSGNVYVADTGNDRIQVFHSTGQYLVTWGSYGSLNGYFIAPEGIAIDSSGTMYVADTGNNRIQKISRDGTVITTWGSGGTESGQFTAPSGVALDYWGNVYVSDASSRIQTFSPAGEFLSSCRTGGRNIAIATDSSGTVYALWQSGTRWTIGQLGPRSPTYVTASTPRVRSTISIIAERENPRVTPATRLTTAVTTSPVTTATPAPAPAADDNATMAAPVVEETLQKTGTHETLLDPIARFFRNLFGGK
ncbi:6-bladed beta-propeller [Methanoregula sp.]|uniref:6-bladed beta-propeller n=1 Tax=Methanoregula sp. TaxID=2052170 RepID=UPI0023731328|nr:6-bladed beta-propeller [Methanoregula sp.]MDD1687120.1 6-bladed beta-propeller [Methanoregula sp.]